MFKKVLVMCLVSLLSISLLIGCTSSDLSSTSDVYNIDKPDRKVDEIISKGSNDIYLAEYTNIVVNLNLNPYEVKALKDDLDSYVTKDNDLWIYMCALKYLYNYKYYGENGANNYLANDCDINGELVKQVAAKIDKPLSEHDDDYVVTDNDSFDAGWYCAKEYLDTSTTVYNDSIGDTLYKYYADNTMNKIDFKLGVKAYIENR